MKRPLATFVALAALGLSGLGTSGEVAAASPSLSAVSSTTAFGPGFVDLGAIAPGIPTLVGNSDATVDSAVVNGRLVFAATALGTGVEPWVTDGTRAGTRRLRDIVPGGGASYPEAFVPFRGRVYFSAVDAFGDRELWATDGTPSGTRRVLDVYPSGSSYIRRLTPAGDRLYFTANVGTGMEIGSYTPEGGARVFDLMGGPDGSDPSDLTAWGGRVVFSASVDGARHAFVYGGTSTSMATLDVELPGTDLDPQEFTSIGSRLVFRAGNGASGAELWQTDGRAAGAAGVKDLRPGPEGSTPQRFTRLGATAVFAARTAEGDNLWTTDGTPGGSQMLRDFAPNDGRVSGPAYLLGLGGTVFFAADDGVHGPELWRTGGTVGSTRMVRDLRPGAAGSHPRPLAGFGRRVVFTADVPGVRSEPHVYDTVTGRIARVADLNPGDEGSEVTLIGTLGATMISAAQVNGRFHLYAYTATPSVTRARPARSYSRSAGRSRQVRVPVRVTGDGRSVPGTVTLYRGNRVVGRARVVNGVARVRIITALGSGRHVLRAAYSGSIHAQSSRSSDFTVRIR